MARDLGSVRKTRDMLHNTIAQRRARDFSERSKMPIKYGFPVHLTFCAIAEGALGA